MNQKNIVIKYLRTFFDHVWLIFNLIMWYWIFESNVTFYYIFVSNKRWGGLFCNACVNMCDYYRIIVDSRSIAFAYNNNNLLYFFGYENIFTDFVITIYI